MSETKLNYGKLIPVQVWRYWESKTNGHLSGYYDGYFNLDNKILCVAFASGEKWIDEFGTRVAADLYITYQLADDTIGDMGIDTGSWERIKKYYDVIDDV